MTSQMGIRLTAEQLTDLDEIAATQHNTRSGIIRLAVDQFREAFHRQNPPDMESVVDEDEVPLAVGFAKQPTGEAK